MVTYIREFIPTIILGVSLTLIINNRIKRMKNKLMCAICNINPLSNTLTQYSSYVEPSLKCSVAEQTEYSEEEFLQVKQYQNEINILKNVYARDWCYDKELVILSENTTIQKALEHMHTSKTTCALLYTDNNSLIGVLDTPNVIRYILRSASSMSSSAKRVIRQCVIATPNTSVSEICKHLCSGMRYIAVCCNDGKHQIISQRSLVSTIFNVIVNNQYYLELFSEKIININIGKKCPLITCNKTCNAKEAFQLMAAYDVTSLPILDSEDNVCGVISATDILYARNDAYLLNIDVLNFVSQSRSDANNSRSVNTIVSCKMNDDLITILRIMMHEEIHHIYILEKNKLLGVISFVDILRYMSNIDWKLPESDIKMED